MESSRVLQDPSSRSLVYISPRFVHRTSHTFPFTVLVKHVRICLPFLSQSVRLSIMQPKDMFAIFFFCIFLLLVSEFLYWHDRFFQRWSFLLWSFSRANVSACFAHSAGVLPVIYFPFSHTPTNTYTGEQVILHHEVAKGKESESYFREQKTKNKNDMRVNAHIHTAERIRF